MVLTGQDSKLLGELLADIDEQINGLDRAVFEAAYHRYVVDLEAQKALAMYPAFQPAIKTERDRRLEQRNLVAKILGFGPRQPHDMSPRDYIVGPDGLLVARSS